MLLLSHRSPVGPTFAAWPSIVCFRLPPRSKRTRPQSATARSTSSGSSPWSAWSPATRSWRRAPFATTVFIWTNLLTASVVFQALTWLFQIMPLFFFAGVAASVESFPHPAGPHGANWGNWLMRRCTRLYRPCSSTWRSGSRRWRSCGTSSPSTCTKPVAGISIQLLWFLGAYVLVLAAVPLLARTPLPGASSERSRARMCSSRSSTRSGSASAGPTGLGYLNLIAWLIPGMLGVAYRRRLIRCRDALVLGAGMLVVNLLLIWLGPYELSLVGLESQRLKNMTPPSLLLAGHAIMMCAFAIAAAPAIARWARRPRVLVADRDRQLGAMTLYLWHIPPLLAMHLAFDYLGHPRYDADAAGFIMLSVVTAGDHGHHRRGGVRVSASAGEQSASAVGRRLCGRTRPAQCDGQRAAVCGGCGDAGVGRLGSQGSRPVLRRGHAGLAGRSQVTGHRPARGRTEHSRGSPTARGAAQRLTALAAEFPAVLERPMGLRLLVAAVSVVGAACGFRVLFSSASRNFRLVSSSGASAMAAA